MMRSPRIIGIEIAIDFFPKCTSDELRWRMVGALHRHHWAKPELFNGPMADLHHTYAVAKKNVATASTASRPGAGPEDAEAAGEGAGTLTRTNYVIREPEDFVDDRLKAGGGKAREHSDFDLGREDVRDRVLRLEGHRAPFIDSTVYRGASDAPVLIRIQNKVTDRRNPEAGTWEDLGPESRRARIEVRLLHDAVREAGFRDLEDLRGFRFQGLRKDFFGLWLPMIPGGPNAKGMVGPGQDYRGRQQQRLFAASGVYGFKLDELAREERTKAMRRKFKDEGEEIGQRPDYRFAKRNHLKAWAEMNDKVDTALRRLTREWGR